ncbi:unnamed protein product [Knipowitschia caucasica]
MSALTKTLSALTVAWTCWWCVTAEVSLGAASSTSSISSSSALRNSSSSASTRALQPPHNATDSRQSTLMRSLPSLRSGVFFLCAVTAALVLCLLLKVLRSGRRIRRTRKYDIMMTPGERMEMASLNQEDPHPAPNQDDLQAALTSAGEQL